MNIWLVSPAWRRFSITRLALAERRWLCDELAARGHRANSVIVADDDNLDVAAEFGFPTVEMDNSDLGRRFNAGYRFAADQGCELFVHIGSDDWLHPDALNILDEVDLEKAPAPIPTPGNAVVWRRTPQLVAQRRILLVDLARQQSQRCFVHSKYGCIPWLIPRSVMQAARFAPIAAGHMRGIDGALVRGLKTRPNWLFQDAPDEWCVDFKTETNVTPYKGVASNLGVGDEEPPWLMLSDFYPDWLVEAAKTTAAELA